MANERYHVIELTNAAANQKSKQMNTMAEEGWQFVAGWSAVQPSRAMNHTQGAVDIVTTLVFEREQQPEKYTLLSEEMALDWTTVQPDYGDSILKREMAAARDDARPVEDPLIKGLTR